jgi:hypothetical protein
MSMKKKTRKRKRQKRRMKKKERMGDLSQSQGSRGGQVSNGKQTFLLPSPLLSPPHRPHRRRSVRRI